jgi:hypothetical protein
MDDLEFQQRFRSLDRRARKRIAQLALSGRELEEPRLEPMTQAYVRRAIARFNPTRARLIRRGLFLALLVGLLVWSLLEADWAPAVLYTITLILWLYSYLRLLPRQQRRMEETARANGWPV